MVETSDRLAQAETHIAKTRAALDDVDKVLATADQALEAAAHARVALRKVWLVVPVFALVLAMALLVRQKRKDPAGATQSH